MSKPGFWDNNSTAQARAKELNNIKNRLQLIADIEEMLENTQVYLELLEEGESDSSQELEKNLSN